MEFIKHIQVICSIYSLIYYFLAFLYFIAVLGEVGHRPLKTVFETMKTDSYKT